MVLSDGQGLANLSFAGSTARNTSECGMASGKIALDRRVRNAGTVGRGTGRSRPRSSVADDMQAQGGLGWVGLAASCRSRPSGVGFLPRPTTRLNYLTVRFQGRADYR